MALVGWKAAVSGDWSNVAPVPTSLDDAETNLIGNCIVSAALAKTAHSQCFNAFNPQLLSLPPRP
jgi:hypothetical protein